MPVSEAAFEAVRKELQEVQRDIAVQDERDKSVNDRLTKMETILSRLTWIVITAAGGSIVAWIFNGGLAPVTRAAAGI
jgi:hypothetical protein